MNRTTALLSALLLAGCVQNASQMDTRLQELAAAQDELRAGNSSSSEAIMTELRNIREKQEETASLAGQIRDLRAENSRLLKEMAALKRDRAPAAAQFSQSAGTAEKEVVYSSKPSTKKSADGKIIVGSEEWGLLEDYEIALLGRTDTGATTSGLHAVNIERFERDGKKWVGFDLPDLDGQLHHLEGRLVRSAAIVQSSNADGTQERPVVQMKLKVGDVSKKAEFTLVDRSHMQYSMLLGREFMKDDVVVDIGLEQNQGRPEASLYIGKKKMK